MSFWFFSWGRRRRQDFLAGRTNRRSGDPLLDRFFTLESFTVCFGETLAESFHATGCVNEFVLAGKERMTSRANVHFDQGDGGTSNKLVAARASNSGCFVFGVYTFLHKRADNNKDRGK